MKKFSGLKVIETSLLVVGPHKLKRVTRKAPERQNFRSGNDRPLKTDK